MSPRAKNGALTDKQKRFVKEYVIDLNATQAYLRAGYKCSEAAAGVNGFKLLKNTKIAKSIAKEQKKLSDRTSVTQEYVVNGLKQMAELTGERAQHGAKVQAYVALGKHLGIFIDKKEIKLGLTDSEVAQKIIEELNSRG